MNEMVLPARNRNLENISRSFLNWRPMNGQKLLSSQAMICKQVGSMVNYYKQGHSFSEYRFCQDYTQFGFPHVATGIKAYN